MTDPLLIQRILDEVATPAEIARFREMLQGMDQQEYARWIDDYLSRAQATSADSGKWRDTGSLQNLLQKIEVQQPRVHFLKMAWFKYAAAVLIILTGVAVYYAADRSAPTQTPIVKNTPPVDLPPASGKAVLTLSNGQQIQLHEGVSETIKEGTLAIGNRNGTLLYNEAGNTTTIATNTVTTPNGGLFKLTLSDGTKVWLNAASSITYPVAFVTDTRTVRISGEVYFEVAKDAKRPFLVDVNGQSTVEVLGTHFNINSYANEEAIKTTLLEGSVKVANVLLKPGQQAIWASAGGISIKDDADLDQAMAWKNGLFTFNNAGLPSVMRQLERWYDIKVEYNGKLPDIILKGKMYRNVYLSDVLEFLHTSGVATRMEGKTLIVL